jgi:hypothetical protein
VYQFGALHTSLAAGSGFAQLDTGAFTGQFTKDALIQSAVMLAVFG